VAETKPKPVPAGGSGTVPLGSGATGGAQPPPESYVGRILDGRWRIVALLGSGGMGAVYRAEHVHIGRTAAVKLLHADVARSPAERDRFRREARIAVKLRSPHVVEVVDFGEDADGRLFIVMELLHGESLRARLAREGRLAPERAVRLLRQLLDGLGAAHAAGIVHRDLKPDNLWVSGAGDDEQIKILDFGVAKSADPADRSRTQRGLVVGTPEYLAPEQAVGDDVDARADLYAVGILAYVLLAGRHPFVTSDVRALLAAHAFEPVPSPSVAVPELAAWPRLLDFVARATEKDRERRAASAAELRRILDGAELPVRPGSRTPRTEGSTGELARPSLTGIPTLTTGPRPVNLTLVRGEIVAWPSRAAALSREERARVLGEHDALVLPAVAAFGGTRLHASGEMLLVGFGSPTDAVQFSAAVQDLLARRALAANEAEALTLRMAVHQGEVRFERGAPAGPPVAVLGSLLASVPAGEIWLTRGVYLTMSRSEVPVEEMGPRLVEGAPEPLALYRVAREAGELPYGGRQLARAAARVSTSFLAPIASGWTSIRVAGGTEGKLRASLRVAAALAALAVLGLVRATSAAVDGVVRAVYWLLFGRRALPPPVARFARILLAGREWARGRQSVLLLRVKRPGGTGSHP